MCVQASPPSPLQGLFMYHGLACLPEKENPWLQGAWDIHYQSFSDFKSYADTLGSVLLIVMIPPKEQIYFSQKLRELHVVSKFPKPQTTASSSLEKK